MLHDANYSDLAAGITTFLTSTYNTGWMNGDIKGAFLSDTSTASLVASGELVTNGTFDTDTTGWTAYNSATLSVVSGKLRTTNGAASSGGAGQAITTVIGKIYTLTVELTGTNGFLHIGTSIGNTSILGRTLTLDEKVLVSFVATSTTTWITVSNNNASLGVSKDWDNISVKLADADRSVNNKGLIVNGTITRTAVASGADLVAYSGFSASNYLEQPYNSALDFGTGNFCVMGWVNFGAIAGASTAETVMFGRGGTNQFYFAKRSGVNGIFFSQAGRDTWSGSVAVSANVWTHVALIRRGGSFTIAVNGVESASQTLSTINFSLANGAVRLGLRSDGVSAFSTSGSGLALWRISATAPTATQIAKIYEDELPLFQVNARATLYGASDAVTALAHDPDTGLLHVGTSAGRSVFRGLERLSNTTTSVAATISASGGLVVSK
jgi:hypothetical protein